MSGINKLFEHNTIYLIQHQWWYGQIPLYRGERCSFGEDNEDPPKPAEHYSGSVEKH